MDFRRGGIYPSRAVCGTMNARGSSRTPTPTVGADSISARGACAATNYTGGMNPSPTHDPVCFHHRKRPGAVKTAPYGLG